MRLMRDLVGDTFASRYRLVARIAGGGMGEVYRAHDLLLDRPVAVKVLQPSLASDPALVERFRMEARSAARLTHPNVVGVYDWGEEDDRTYYMVMEYVPGTDLRELLAPGALAPGHAVEIMASVADALAAAHSAGLVHRDVKPENILISRAGVTKVADFGIAAVQDAERTSPGGHIPGTARYLAPEQARGHEGTFASDIWAAGAVLFECLTGSPPTGGAGADLMRRRSEERPVPPSRFDPRIPSELDDVVLQACALDPNQRFRGGSEMASALRFAGARSVRTTPPVASLMRDVTSDVRVAAAVSTPAVGRVGSGKRRRLKFRRLIGLLLVLGLVGFGSAKGLGAILGPHEVDVPKMDGLTVEEARKRADESGLEIALADQVRDAIVPEGHVVSQDPSDGVLLEGKTIQLVVSAGPPLKGVPNIVGSDQEDAEAAIVGAGFVVGETTFEFSTKQPKDAVISLVPKDGRAELGSAIDIVISKGPESLEVPKVVGKKAAAAVAILRAAGFDPVLVDTYSDDVPMGRVVSTAPAGLAMADDGSEVQVGVSIGPEFKELRLPDVKGMSVADATKLLEKKGLRVDVIETGLGGDTVAETDPMAGSIVRENDVIALFVY